MRELYKAKKNAEHPHAWLWEPLEADPGFAPRTMFGTKALYYEGRLVLCCAAKEEPWRGILVCTDREHHASLRREFAALVPHPVLSKWLYLSEADDDFESSARRLVVLVRRRDPRVGILPRPRRRGTPVRFTKSDHP